MTTTSGNHPEPDFRDFAGPPLARLAAEICAAGGHGLSVTAPPGADAPALAERIPGILPDLDEGDSFEVTSLHSAAGLLARGRGRGARPPEGALPARHSSAHITHVRYPR